MKQTPQKLLPCPFCGCDQIAIYHDDAHAVGSSLAGYYVSHPVWKEYPKTWNCWQNFSGKFDTEKEAADAWNTRK